MHRIPIAVILVAVLLSFSAGCTKEAPQTGSLEITSTPAGLEVQVILDGDYRGVTPLVLTNIPAGNHSLHLVSSGYGDRRELITVIPGQRMIFSADYPPLPTPTPLTPTPPPTAEATITPTQGNLPVTPLPLGALYVTSFPSGATIYLDGRGYGITPRLIPNLTPGSYELRLSLTGWDDYRMVVSVSPGLIEREDVTLRS
jgi:hypothetical protein